MRCEACGFKTTHPTVITNQGEVVLACPRCKHTKLVPDEEERVPDE